MVWGMNTASPKTASKKRRLSQDAWLSAGFDALALHGADALKVETLAVVLGATKGSFYWHFKDLPEFQSRLLFLWEAHALEAVETITASDDPPASRLRELAQLIASRSQAEGDWQRSEPSIRAWAHVSEQASDTIAKFDDFCLGAFSGLLAECGVTNPDLTRAIYAASIGMADLSTRDDKSNDGALGTLVDLVLALR